MKNREIIQITKQNMINRLIIIIYGLFAYGIIKIMDIPSIHISVFWGMVILAIVLVKFDLFHPYFWFSLFFGLYNSANAILHHDDQSYCKEQILMPLFALTIFLIVVGSDRKKHSDYLKCNDIIKGDFLSKIIWFLIILTIVFSLFLHIRGYQSKVQMRESGDLSYRLGVHIARYLVLFCLIYTAKIRISNNTIPVKILIGGGIATLVFSLMTSERDVVFRYGFTFLLLLYIFDIIKKKHLLFLFPVAMFAMTASVYVKHYFLRGVFNDAFVSNGNIFTQFLSTDFSAAGDNLQYLLDREDTRGRFGLSLFFTELFSPILIGVNTINPDNWFNTEIHHSSYGHAFTLVGTGYIIAGYLGLLLVFASVGLIVKIFYKKSDSNIYWLAGYVYMTSVVIFSFRQSLGTVTGALLKHILVAVLFCMAFDKIINRKKC